MANTYVRIPGAENTNPAATEAIPLDSGTASGWTQIANLHKNMTTSTTAAAGVVELATDAEALAGVDSTRALTATNLSYIRPSSAWIPETLTWTRTGNHTFTIAADVTAIYTKGTRVRYKDGGAFEYGVVTSSSFGAPNTTVTLITNSDYAMAAATITDTYYSYANPPDFPVTFNWAPAIVGWTTPPTTVSRWAAFGNIIHLAVRQAAAAVSDSTVTTLSLPVAAKTVTDMVWSNTCRIADNGISIATPGLMQIVSAGTLLEFYKDMIATVWTASGNKRIFSGGIFYEY